MIKIRPLGDMSLIRPVFEEYHGVLQMPDVLDKAMIGGEVLAKGPKVSDAFNVGDRVVFGHWVGITVDANARTPEQKMKSDKLIKEFEIIGIVEK